MCPDQRPDGLFLIKADFKDQMAAWFQEADGFLDQPANHVQPARAAIEGRPRLVIADAGFEMLNGPARYVGRIRNDRIERTFPCERLELASQSNNGSKCFSVQG